jgi:hypothetical protein
MSRILPSIALVSMAFIVAEVLSGSTPITHPIRWPFLLLIYGPGALLIRESVRRRKRGWESVVLLGAAYGFVEPPGRCPGLFCPAPSGPKPQTAQHQRAQASTADAMSAVLPPPQNRWQIPMADRARCPRTPGAAFQPNRSRSPNGAPKTCRA